MRLVVKANIVARVVSSRFIVDFVIMKWFQWANIRLFFDKTIFFKVFFVTLEILFNFILNTKIPINIIYFKVYILKRYI